MWISILCVLVNKIVYMWQEKVYDPKTRQTNDYCAHDLYPNSQLLVTAVSDRFRSKRLIHNTYVYLLFAIVHNKVIPGYKDITFHIFS